MTCKVCDNVLEAIFVAVMPISISILPRYAKYAKIQISGKGLHLNYFGTVKQVQLQ